MSYISNKDYKYRVALGEVSGASTVNKFGYNEDVDVASGEELIAGFGGTFDPLTDIITTAQTFTIAYDTASDGLGQTGALSLLISYLDASYAYATAIHTLSNTGSDVTAFTGFGINRVVVLSNGGDGWNGADITITATTDTTTQALVPALQGVTQQLLYHTAQGHQLNLDWLELNALKLTGAGGSPRITFRAYSWSRVTLTRYNVFQYRMDTSVENHLELNPSQPFPVGGREVFYITAETDTNNTAVNARFSGIDETL